MSERDPVGDGFPTGTPVDVWVPYTNRWCGGYLVHEPETPDGYRLRRVADGEILPAPIEAGRLRTNTR